MDFLSPFVSLTIFFIVIIVLLVFFWPNFGIIARYKKGLLSTKRVLIEDTLKHLYDYEYRNLSSTIKSIAGTLNISTDEATKLLEQLKTQELVLLDKNKISLTPAGRSYALRIIRIHRLWENYLAEETSYGELDWHEKAELIEHKMTNEEANKLAAKMGNPKFDPHGDPIPTAEGEVPKKKGKCLNNIKPGEVVKIIHIEDEPKIIYTQLVAQGFHPGKEIQVIDANSERIKIAMDGDERIIAPLLAGNVTVDIISKPEFTNIKLRTLSDIKKNEKVKIHSLAPTCRGQQRRRLLDLGIVPGAEITILMKSPLNDPIGYLVKDTIVALRKKQAECIIIENQKSNEKINEKLKVENE